MFVSTHSRLKAAGVLYKLKTLGFAVSTHSRLKAAGIFSVDGVCPEPSFNTQPPEGGWPIIWVFIAFYAGFNTQPPEGGWKVLAMCHPVLLAFQHTAA